MAGTSREQTTRRPRPPRSGARGLVAAAVAALTALATGCGDGGAGGPSPEVWRFAIEETAGSVQDEVAREFARRVAERTGGAVEVKVYPYGTLGTSDDLAEQAAMGSLQFAMASPGHLGKVIPEVQVFLLHFLFSDDDEVNRRALADPALAARLEPLYEERGLRLLSVLFEGWMVWTTRKEVRRPSDFEGVKIRTMTSPLLLEAYRAYGASPQSMPYAEVYGGLQLNMIDAQVNPVFAIEEMSFYEVTSHLVFAKPAPFVTTVVAHPGFLDGLSEERRAMVREVTAELEPYAFEVQREFNRARLEEMLERKPELEVVELTEAERDAFRERSIPVRDSFVETAGASGRAVLDEVLAAVRRAEEAVATEATEAR
ncbi:MAG: TRAP transporter substrate-binding protein DctP [Planctomycetota bacterium JB042]